MGGFGGGGQQAQAPQLSVGQTLQLNEGQIELLQKYLPGLTSDLGAVNRREGGLNTVYGLNMLIDPRGTLATSMREDAGRERREDMAQLEEVRKTIGEEEYKQRKGVIDAQYDRAITASRELNPVEDIKRVFGDQFAKRDELIKDLGRSAASTPEFTRMQTALGQGTQAQTVNAQQAATAQAQAAGMGNVANVSAQQVGAGRLGESLMNQALERSQSGGRLSAEASRDAVQAARSGMAARGMATGNAGLAAEMLNRDRFARARQAEDLAFAQGVQGQDLTRQFNNVGNAMQAALANQQTQFGREQIISGNQQQAALANMQQANAMNQFNTGQRAAADVFNAGQRTDTTRYNLGLLQASSQMADAERARRMGVLQDSYNFQMQTDPRLMVAGLGSPYANMTQPALGQLGALTGNVNPIYTGGQFSSGGLTGGLVGGAMGAAGGALSGAAMGTMIGPGWGTALGAGLGALGGLTGFMGGSR